LSVRLPTDTALDAAAAALTSWHCFNRMIGQLYHCLQHGQHFDETVAFPEGNVAPQAAAA
ncbi:hypothetical protein ABT398_38785, partial [Streptomyces hydrogenans]